MAKPNQMKRFAASKQTVSPRGEAWANPSAGGTANKSGGRGKTDTTSFSTKKVRKS